MSSGPKGSGQWQRITWDAAIAEIVGNWQAIIAEHGAAAIQPYSYSGTLGLLQNAICSERLWNRMGASGLDRAICGAAAETAVEATLGARWSPDPADVLDSKLVLIWGHNPASTGPHFMPLLRRARLAPDAPAVRRVGRLTLDEALHTVTAGTAPVDCTPCEFAIVDQTTR